jgi:serine/threonine protein phosphatase PrpC
MTVRGGVAFDAYTFSERGGRRENQDCAGSGQSGALACWALADGLGGHHGGSTAARVAVEAIVSAFEAAPACTPEAVRSYLEAAEAAVRQRQQSEHSLRGMRSTAVALVASATEAVWAHIGDTRLYFFRGGRVAEQTRDHSVPQALADGGEITAEQIRFHEDRGRLLRSLGAGSFRPAVGGVGRIAAGDAFLLCTDGFWEFVREESMERELAAARSAQEWVERMRVAVSGEDRDNCSAIGIVIGRR